jgi:predicted flavoprotein YhiN
MPDFDLIIIGAGTTGLMGVIESTRRGRRVLVLERAENPGKKIRISDGGRANFTNLHASPLNFLSDNSRFCVSTLNRYTPDDFISLIEKHVIACHECDHGQLFCDGSAQKIIDMLTEEARGVALRMSTVVTGNLGGFNFQWASGHACGQVVQGCP